MKKKIIFTFILCSILVIPLGANYFASVKYDLNQANILEEDKEDLLMGRHHLVTEYKEDETSKKYASISLKNKINIPAYKTMVKEHSSKKQTRNLNENEKEKYLSDIIKVIKESDASFDEKDYKIEYSLPNEEENTGTIFLTYYIDNLVETNKVYLVEIVNGVVENITLGGVLEENIKEISSTDNEELKEIASEFAGAKKEKAIIEKSTEFFKTNEILNKDNTIRKDNLTEEVVNSKEQIIYDYNSKKLQYVLSIVYKTPTNTYDGEAIEIDLN